MPEFPSSHRTRLEDRGVLRLTGPERVGFLQGLVSNDVTRVAADASIYAALLTPQGKFLHEMFIIESEGALLLDVDAARRDDLLVRLRRYRLRAKVEFEDVTEGFAVLALYGAGAAAAVGLPETPGATGRHGGGLALVDPRLAELGARLVVSRAASVEAPVGTGEDYHRLCLVLGVPDGRRDMVVEKSLLLENNLDVLNAISWTKGCYVGQEVTARTRYRGLVRRRLRPVRVDGPLPEPGTAVWCGEQEVGEVRSGLDTLALALLPLEGLGASAVLTAGGATLTPLCPAWDRR